MPPRATTRHSIHNARRHASLLPPPPQQQRKKEDEGNVAADHDTCKFISPSMRHLFDAASPFLGHAVFGRSKYTLYMIRFISDGRISASLSAMPADAAAFARGRA